MPSEPTLSELKAKLAEEDRLYAELLEKLDELAHVRAPYDEDESLAPRLEELNQSPALTEAEAPAAASGVKGLARRFLRRLVEPELAALRRELDHQRSFNSSLVQFLNRFAETVNRTQAAHAQFTSTLIGFTQRIDRLADAKDRLYASLANARADLLLEAMDKRLETVRLGLQKIHQRVEGMDSSLTIARAEIRGLVSDGPDSSDGSDQEATAATPSPGFEAEHYVAFEDRFRGSSDELKSRLRDYVADFEDRVPVVDLGCGRGEFLELLQEAGLQAKGIDGNREMVHACRDKGLDAEVGDIVDYIAGASSGETGGVFAAQVIEHLPPALLRKFLADCYRALRQDGRIVLETVNPESVVAFVAFYRDLTHQKPLHPETLDFLLRAVGFRDVETRYRSPVSERARLLHVADGNETLNQNFDKLNALLFAEQDYAVIGTK